MAAGPAPKTADITIVQQVGLIRFFSSVSTAEVPQHKDSPILLGYLSAIYPAASAFFASPSQCSQPHIQLNPEDLSAPPPRGNFLFFLSNSRKPRQIRGVAAVWESGNACGCYWRKMRLIQFNSYDRQNR
jgi:hypothetical protein